MNDSMLTSFLQLIAGLSAIRKDDSLKLTRKFLEDFINRNFGKRYVKPQLDKYDQLLNSYLKHIEKNTLINGICKEINSEYSNKQKFLLIINLLNFFTLSTTLNIFNESNNSNEKYSDEIDQIAKWLNVNFQEYINFRLFSSGQLNSIPNKSNLLIISDQNPNLSSINFYQCKGLKGYITIYLIDSASIMALSYNGTSLLEINRTPIFSKQTYIVQNDTIISSKSTQSLYYGELLSAIKKQSPSDIINLTANNISYSYPNSKSGINNVSFSATSCNLIGILGGSGVGKSTLIKILCGNLKPTSGEVTINGLNLYDSIEIHHGLFGVMHQEECLLEELTVYENLYYSAKLSLGNISETELKQLVTNKLYELDLIDCKDNRVGPPENRQLSGGQRKRLAIALEIIREPKVLFVDEPTSGLSSADSLMVMTIFKNIALSGILVIVNIHQPSSEIYKLFDSILIIDKGGTPVFNGNPIEAILHFKGAANRVDKDQSICQSCGTVKPEIIFELLEEKFVDTIGQSTTKRKKNPTDWHNIFYQQKYSIQNSSIKSKELPKAKFNNANGIRQYAVFLSRGLLTKIRNLEFIFFALILPPVLSVIISVFLRYSIPSGFENVEYNIYSNPNLPSFVLMCILSALFFGLIISCEDIIRDQRIIKRETYIGLNIKCFYNSKLSFLVILSAFQIILFIIPGLLIIELNGMSFAFWLLLFLLSIFGNLMGLILSSSLKSVVAIYILVPFLLIPQILFSGLVVRFDNLNTKLNTSDYVPLVGEGMASRWAVEAALVYYFKENNYSKPFFNLDFKESELRFRLLHLIPELNHFITNLPQNSSKLKEDDVKIISSGLSLLVQNQALPNIDIIPWPNGSLADVTDFLVLSRNSIAKSYSDINRKKDVLVQSLYANTPKGRELLALTRQTNYNKAVEDLLENKFYPVPLIKQNNSFVQKSDPIYRISNSPIGRSHLFAPYKKIGPLFIDTYWFNVFVLSLMLLLLYILFIFRVIPRFIEKTAKAFSLYSFKP